MYYEKNNTLSCETEDGKVLSTKSGERHSGKVEGLRDWIEGPDCSDGPDRTCQHLAFITSYGIRINHAFHDGVKIECIEDHGRRLGKKIHNFYGTLGPRKGGVKYTLACKHNDIVLSTSKDTLSRLKKWARGPSCQPTFNFSTTQSTREVSTTVRSSACPRLHEVQAEIKNEAKLKCIEDYGEQYKVACYNHDGNEDRDGDPIQSVRTGNIEYLKKWAGGRFCGQGCECQEQFATLNKAKCVWPNKWQCQKTTVTGSCSGTVTQILQNVKPNLKKKRPETKKKHCEKLARRTGCDPLGYVPKCEN